MYQRAEIKYSLYNYIILFLIYIGNMIKYLVSPRKKKYAKIYPIIEAKYVYDEESYYSSDCINQFDALTNKPFTQYYKNTKSKID